MKNLNWEFLLAIIILMFTIFALSAGSWVGVAINAPLAVYWFYCADRKSKRWTHEIAKEKEDAQKEL